MNIVLRCIMRRMSVLLGMMLVATMSLVVAVPSAAFAGVGTAPDDTARVNGTVYAIAQVGDLTIIGGSFTTVGGQPRSNIAAIRPNGRLDPNFKPDVNGTVYAIAGSADASTVFIGGLFGSAGGAARANLAAVDAVSGTALPDWVADTTGTTPEVLTLAVSGPRLYVGGRFGGIDGTLRKRIAAVDAGAGNVIKSFNPAPDLAAVRNLAVSPDGTRVFAAGAFTYIGGQSRPNSVAELFAATGLATSFNPSLGGGRVTAMNISPAGDRVYFGTENNTLFAYDATSDHPAWTIKTGGDTQAIAVTPTEIYFGGHFGQVLTYKAKRQWIASARPDGTLTDWNPMLGGGSMGVWALATTATHLLVGGEFTSVAGVNHPRFARFAGTP